MVRPRSVFLSTAAEPACFVRNPSGPNNLGARKPIPHPVLDPNECEGRVGRATNCWAAAVEDGAADCGVQHTRGTEERSSGAPMFDQFHGAIGINKAGGCSGGGQHNGPWGPLGFHNHGNAIRCFEPGLPAGSPFGWPWLRAEGCDTPGQACLLAVDLLSPNAFANFLVCLVLAVRPGPERAPGLLAGVTGDPEDRLSLGPTAFWMPLACGTTNVIGLAAWTVQGPAVPSGAGLAAFLQAVVKRPNPPLDPGTFSPSNQVLLWIP